MAQQHVLVVGAGIIGASIAWHLARAGARVTIVDTAEPGGIATAHSWAWINASWGNPLPYFRLRAQAMADWHRVAADLPALGVRFPGGLLWDLPEEELETYAASHADWGYAIRLVDRAEAQRIEPSLAAAPELAVFASGEGVVEPVAAARAFLAAAESLGANFRRAEVTGVLEQAGRVTGIATKDGMIGADHVVLAAGTATSLLAATIGIEVPLESPPGLLVRTMPVAPCLNGLVMSPALHVRQLADGSLLAGADFGGSDPGADAEATARGVFGDLQSLLKVGAGLAYQGYGIGYRPLPKDGFPIAGPSRLPGLTLCVTHSGVTLAPALGVMLANEILEGTRDPLLGPYHPSRFGA